MAGSVAKLENATGALGQAQAQAIDGIIAEERASGEAISAFLNEIEALPIPAAARAELSPAQVLVLKHALLHLPQMAIALVIDLFAPISTLLFWAAALKSRARTVPVKMGDHE